MTRTILSLHTTLWPRNIKSNPSQIILLVVIGIYGLPLVASIVATISDQAAHEELFYLAALQALGVLAYCLLAFFYPSPELNIDPARLAPLPVRAKDVSPGLLLASFLQIRTAIAAVSTLITIALPLLMVDELASAPLAIAWSLSCVLSFVLAVVAAEAISALGGIIGGSSARMKALYALLGLVALGAAVYFSLNAISDPLAYIDAALRVLAWTPLAAPGSAVLLAGAGQPALAALMAAAFCGPVALFVWLHRRGVANGLDSRNAATTARARTSQRGSILVPFAPQGRWGAIYSRALVYWLRDKRFSTSIFTTVAAAALFLVLGATQTQFQLIVGVFLLVILAATATANDYGYDGPANWVHMAAGVPGKTMVSARAATAATISIPVLVVYLAIATAIVDDPSVIVTVAFISIPVAVGGIGIGTLLSVLNPFPTARPGTNAFRDNSGFSGNAMLTSLVALFLWIPLVPGLILMAIPMIQQHKAAPMASPLYWGGIVLTVAIAAGIFLLGTAIAAKRLDKKWPEIFQKVRHYL